MRDFIFEDVFASNADVIVVPISTNGTCSASFQRGLDFHDVTLPHKTVRYRLGDILVRQTKGMSTTRYIILACSVDGRPGSSYAAIRQIAYNLADWTKEVRNIKLIASPILGSGAGNLRPFESHNILVNAFYERNPESTTSLDIYTLDKAVYDSFEGNRLNLDKSSANLVLDATLGQIMEDDTTRRITTENNFYFQLAKNKYREFISFEPPSPSFYNQLEVDFRNSRTTFSNYIKSVEGSGGEAYRFLKLCGELISYMDYHAYNKRVWNEYADHRVLANASVRQNIWLTNLLRFKDGTFDQVTSSNVLNALIYLDDPYQNLNILSERHRASINDVFFAGSTQRSLTSLIFEYFNTAGIRAENPVNNGALYTRIFYHPDIRAMWSADKRQGSYSHDSEIAYQLIMECLYDGAKVLDLGNCGITSLEDLPDLFRCTHLEELILSNQWALFEGGRWRQYSSDNSGAKNRITHLPAELKRLKRLKVLICGGDWNSEKRSWNRWKIEDMSPVLSLRSLIFLNLSNNEISYIPDLSDLTQLRVLHLNNNRIHFISALEGMENLEELYLSNNELEDVGFIGAIPNLHTLDLHANRIRDLRPLEDLIATMGVVNSKWYPGTINIAKNPLELPPMETVVTGKDAVLRYFIDIRSGNTYINKDVKFILMGNSEAGKSTLAKYINHRTDLDKPHSPTHWMEEKVIESNYFIDSIGANCTIRLFDFGGHDYFHDTHHLFFGVNTIYILLWETATNHLFFRSTVQNENGRDVPVSTQDYPIRYWLDSVRYFTRERESDNFGFEIEKTEAYNSRMLIAQNKVDLADQIDHLDNRAMKAKYPFVYDFLNISIYPIERNMAHFDAVITEMLNGSRIIGAELPDFYRRVKESLQDYSGTPVLQMAAFHRYCNNLPGVDIDIDQTRYLVSYLKQIGVVLWFPNGATGDRIYVHKKWVIDNIYRALKGLKDNKGEFNRSDLIARMGKTDDTGAESLLEIMIEFRIIFRHPQAGTERYIAPLYLPNEPGNAVKLFLKKDLKPYRRFEYEGFIHKHVVLDIFQRYGSLLLSEKSGESDTGAYYYWKNGLIIKDVQTEEIVMIKFFMGNNHGCAHIDIFNIGKDSKRLIDGVAAYIREINVDYEIDEMVTLDGNDFLSLKLLEKLAGLGRLEFTEKKLADQPALQKNTKTFKLKDYQMYLPARIKKKKVVISYSKKDVKRVDTFIRYLQPMIDTEMIEKPWYCSDLYAGSEWDEEIQSNFDQADIVFFMVSDHFYSTDYIKRHEIERAIDRYDRDRSIKIVPIILVHYDWARNEPYNLQRFSALPYQAKPISDYKDENIGWHIAASCIKLMIEKDLDPGKPGGIGRELKELYERQVEGKLDNNH
ncbi:leucine-rich repeat domain-containing protein [Pedobacter alluvionis]|uniref:Leucine rich repeat (LRR) protein n=1 Tax=Pedobacter alluvionis TaxID=475253 RepID=A0A497Y1V1_9SPHI|nr:leucine-rich repeat domain-containing protein [Pedobacter alluvionis]RLJ73661.1 leucine rich repeat (LRR) protein [Pedobacter alluvionis]TFB32715.1 TIR domain-containing protein [Pedobacter alluvionis]